jgi:hypothetical protein
MGQGDEPRSLRSRLTVIGGPHPVGFATTGRAAGSENPQVGLTHGMAGSMVWSLVNISDHTIALAAEANFDGSCFRPLGSTGPCLGRHALGFDLRSSSSGALGAVVTTLGLAFTLRSSASHAASTGLRSAPRWPSMRQTTSRFDGMAPAKDLPMAGHRSFITATTTSGHGYSPRSSRSCSACVQRLLGGESLIQLALFHEI